MPVRPITANVLSTAQVRSPAGEDVGKIVDFMLDTERGSVVYAVLAVGGVLGIGAKMLAIRPEHLRLAADRGLEVAVDTATLDEAPGIDRANAPETADAAPLAGAKPQHPHSAERG
jgi:hypothetical protein